MGLVIHKIKSALIVLTIYLLTARPLYAQEMPKRYTVESGIIEYTIGGMRDGIETVYFKDWGMIEARYTKEIVMLYGDKHTRKTLTLWTPDWIYVVDLEKGIASKNENRMAKEYIKLPAEERVIPLNQFMVNRMGGVKVAEDTLLGKPCDDFKIEGLQSRSCFWSWIPLMTIQEFPTGKVYMKAVDIKENVPIPPEKLKLPKGIYFIDGNIDNIILSLKSQ